MTGLELAGLIIGIAGKIAEATIDVATGGQTVDEMLAKPLSYYVTSGDAVRLAQAAETARVSAVDG
jgi:hypothetical protein